MTKALAEMARASAELSAKEKYALANILLNSVEASPESAAEVEAAWEAEIQKRINEFQSGKVQGVPLADTKRKIEKRLAR